MRCCQKWDITSRKHGDSVDIDKIGLTDFKIVICEGDYKEGIKMLYTKMDNAPILMKANKKR